MGRGESLKQCTRCGETKPFSDFYSLKRAKSRLMSACKECWKARQRAISDRRAQRSNIVLPDAATCFTCKRELPASMLALNRTRARGYQSRCKDCHREQRYGLRRGEYDEMLNRQNGVCVLCGEPPKRGKQLEVDHCHETNRVRGLLCGPRNRMLGAAQDRVKVLLAAVEYLERG